MDWVSVTEAYVLAGLPSELGQQYEGWITANPDKAGRLAALTEGVVSDFRQALMSDPQLVLDSDAASVPEACVRHVLNIVFYNIALEMGLSINVSAQTAYSKAEIYLRRIYSGAILFSQGAVSASPSYEGSVEREASVVMGI